MNAFTKTLLVLLIIGGINWGLVGLFNWNLVDAIFGGDVSQDTSALSRLIYVIVGLAAIAAAFILPKVRSTGPHRRAA